jgi:hydroxyacylglutathione hydrolase
MLLKRFYDETLAQASFLIGCDATGEAIVIDPNRDVEQYIRAAESEKVRITQVTETHIHADFVSGARELARRTGARLVLSGEGGPDWQYAFAASDGARVVHDGDTIDVGRVQLTARHTPGHTPEHICFVVTDRATNDAPMGMLTGDFVFVGDVGRPDLLERAAGESGTMEGMARALHRSIKALADLPDYLQLWPGHGAGSACGKALGAVPQTTLGYERIANWAFGVRDEDEFVRMVLADQPEPPKYFARMKQVNRDGPAALDPRQPLELDLGAFDRAVSAGTRVLDVRATEAFAAEHIPGALNVPMSKSFTKWAGSLLSYEEDVVLLAPGQAAAVSAVRVLALIGYDRVVGWAGAELNAAWTRAGRTLESTTQTDPAQVSARKDVTLVDVRSAAEWRDGHADGARHLFLGHLPELSKDLPRDTPIVTMCQGGSRSAIAASLLQARGFTNVQNMTGGFGAWQQAGLPIRHPERP